MSDQLLARSVDILRWLEADAETGYEDRLARDRAIGRELVADDDLGRVLGWWRKISSEASDGSSIGTRVAVLTRAAMVVLGLLGLALGAGLGSVAFAYDGTHPVNVLALLGLLVGLPFLLVVLTLIYLLPGRVPGLGGLRDAVAAMNPGRWAGAWLDRVAGLDLYAGFGRVGGRFARWQLLVFSQWFAVGYFLGVLLAGLVLVAVTDLAFGWSSTLELDSEAVHKGFAFLALPWQSWLPGAVPDAELVARSRYFRLETVQIGGEQAAALGTWWPFVLMTILVWGLLPRLLLLGVGQWRRTAELRAMLCRNPEVLALLDRLRPPRVDFGPELEEESLPKGADAAPPPALAWDEGTGIVIWNEAIGEDEARSWLTRRLGTSGGRLISLAIRDLSGLPADGTGFPAAPGFPGDAERIVVFSKGWEPPLLEFADLLAVLRARCGENATFVVVPINTRRTGIDPSDRAIWAEFLGRQKDARLYVMQDVSEADTQSAGAGR